MIPTFPQLRHPCPWPGKTSPAAGMKAAEAAQVAGDAYEKSCDVFAAIKVAKWLPHTHKHTPRGRGRGTQTLLSYLRSACGKMNIYVGHVAYT